MVDLETTVQGQPTITTFKPENIGLNVQVTPYIFSDGRIELKIDEQFSDLLQLDTDPGRKKSQRSNRELHTFATVPSGYTLALGGILQRQSNVIHKSIPVMNRIPLVKNLFDWETRDTKMVELVLFVTATALEPSKAPVASLSAPMEK